MKVYIPPEKREEYEEREKARQWEEIEQIYLSMDQRGRIRLMLLIRWIYIKGKVKAFFGIKE